MLYWAKYRATPKAFVTLKTAQQLWQSRYGDLTSLRIGPVPENLARNREKLVADEILKQLKPAEMGLVVSAGEISGTSGRRRDRPTFGGLFIGFSLFLILSAIILIGLLFRLGIERRAANVGLLLATGFSPRQVRRLLLAEGGVILMPAASRASSQPSATRP